MGPAPATTVASTRGPPLIEMRLHSGSSWHLECHVRPIGGDYLCTIHGGDEHIGAVALSEWTDGKATTRCLTASGHRERGVAMHAAHRLCTVTHSRVSCIAGIHYESPSHDDIAEIVQAAHELTRRAATRLEQDRLERALASPDGLPARIEAGREEISNEIDAFMALPAESAVAAVRSEAASVAEFFGRRVNLFAPLYLSNACSNDCLYCGFRRSARFGRVRLSVDEAVQEARQLTDLGHRTIDLVTGEIATDRFVDYVCEVTRSILENTRIRRINLNLGALTTDQFRRLAAAGGRSYHLYQETYAPQTYFAVHSRGLKRDMAYRIAGAHRAAEADFDSIGLGILLGLHPVREDLASLASHARILMEDFPTLRIGFSLPRLQHVDAACEYTAAATVDDDTFLKAMLFLRLHFPKAHLTVTTRESQEMRDRLIPLGVTKLSAGVSTAPGGYGVAPSATAQFDIADERSLADMVEHVRRVGLTATFG
jgi:2-iminoacetate synthase